MMGAGFRVLSIRVLAIRVLAFRVLGSSVHNVGFGVPGS
jgi:hypothetical protein